MRILRNLAFYAAFYLGSVGFVLTSLVAIVTVSEERFRKVPNGWSHFHRWCVNHILGITVRVEGVRPEEQSLFAIKHESFFEAIDLATMLDEPVPYAKEELFSIPGWGRVARAYGGIAVARSYGSARPPDRRAARGDDVLCRVASGGAGDGPHFSRGGPGRADR